MSPPLPYDYSTCTLHQLQWHYLYASKAMCFTHVDQFRSLVSTDQCLIWVTVRRSCEQALKNERFEQRMWIWHLSCGVNVAIDSLPYHFHSHSFTQTIFFIFRQFYVHHIPRLLIMLFENDFWDQRLQLDLVQMWCAACPFIWGKYYFEKEDIETLKTLSEWLMVHMVFFLLCWNIFP